MITLTSFSDKDEILKDINLQLENGYGRFKNGNYLVSITCPFFNVSPETIKQWFLKYPLDNELFKSINDGNISVSVVKDSADYFSKGDLKNLYPYSLYQCKAIGGKRIKHKVDFVSEKDFGFSKKLMQENDISLAVCADIKTRSGHSLLAKVALLFRTEREGLFLAARFWIGEGLKNLILRKIYLKESLIEAFYRQTDKEFRTVAEKLSNVCKNN